MKPDPNAPAKPSNIFLDRELSQLMFNRRVMAQAEGRSIRNPYRRSRKWWKI